LISYPVGDDVDVLEASAQELRDIASGEYAPEVTDENLPRYDFDESIQSDDPSWWSPIVATTTTMEDRTVRRWYNEAMDALEEVEGFRTTENLEDRDPMTGEKPPLEVRVRDREQINSTVSIRGEVNRDSISLEEAGRVLSEQAAERRYNHDQVPVHQTEVNGMEMNVEADLSSGFFRVDSPVGGTSMVWMPYANRDEAGLVSMPSDITSTDVDTYTVSPGQRSYTSNPAVDAVAESLEYLLPFEGILQPEVSAEAIEYRNPNLLDTDAQKKIIEEDAWSTIQEMSQEATQRFMEKTDQLALRRGKSPLDRVDGTNVDQITGEVTGEDIFIQYTRDSQSDVLKIQNVAKRHEVYPPTSNQRRK
jgi:hypothetical protein